MLLVVQLELLDLILVELGLAGGIHPDAAHLAQRTELGPLQFIDEVVEIIRVLGLVGVDP